MRERQKGKEKSDWLEEISSTPLLSHTFSPPPLLFLSSALLVAPLRKMQKAQKSENKIEIAIAIVSPSSQFQFNKEPKYRK